MPFRKTSLFHTNIETCFSKTICSDSLVVILRKLPSRKTKPDFYSVWRTFKIILISISCLQPVYHTVVLIDRILNGGSGGIYQRAQFILLVHQQCDSEFEKLLKNLQKIQRQNTALRNHWLCKNQNNLSLKLSTSCKLRANRKSKLVIRQIVA